MSEENSRMVRFAEVVALAIALDEGKARLISGDESWTAISGAHRPVVCVDRVSCGSDRRGSS